MTRRPDERGGARSRSFDSLIWSGMEARHAVQFYESPEALHGSISTFLAHGLELGEPVVLFGRATTRHAVETGLTALGVDVAAEQARGHVWLLDAEDTLTPTLVDGRPDRHRFDRVVGGALDAARQRGGSAVVRAFGEIVDVLWARGERDAALLVEAYWNDLVARRPIRLLCGYALDRFIGDSAADSFGAVCDHHDQVLPGESFAALADVRARDRQVAELQLRARALEAEIERREELELALRDALAQCGRVEEALMKARDDAEQASRAKSDFLAVMSHELRTPLNAIMGYDELLAMEVGGPVTAEQRIFIDRIRSAAQQLLGLVDQILSLSRIEAGKEDLRVEEIELAALAKEAAALVEADARLKGLDLDVALEDEALRCRTDAHKVKQILLNLLSNAVKFTDAGRIDVELRREAQSLCVDVRDTGPGLVLEDCERIFEAFVQVDGTSTRTQGGTGLGLAVCRRLARLLGGDVTVTSAGPGAGSTFTLRLPATPPMR